MALAVLPDLRAAAPGWPCWRGPSRDALSAETERGSFTIPGVEKPSWSHPVVVGGKLYLREQDTLYVYDIRKAA